MARAVFETKIMQIRQVVRDLLDEAVSDNITDIDVYRWLKVRMEVCNELLRECKRVPDNKPWQEIKFQ